ncbi:hypothetical protein KH5H1_76300 [Corallococcus caeni]|uniref:hypothetical protein n=1 Tax=Corallococcus caeni TaxID=3082388 RepID=UPI002956E9AE|nr:hypothetical protein KH5H1_76300 [Corallococcus sp. KH5-1]
MQERTLIHMGLHLAALAVLMCGPDALAVPASPYRVTLTLSEDTVRGLAESGTFLYGFMAVGGTDQAAVPLVWFQLRDYSLTTTLSWQEQWQAYVSLHAAAPSPTVNASAAYGITPGQTLQVQTPQGLGQVVDDGVQGALSIVNQTQAPLTCGLSLRSGGASAPIAAFPLYGNGLQLLVPVKRVLLMFSTVPIEPGTPLRRSCGPGVLMDFSDAPTREISFDLNTGWDLRGKSWARTIPAGSDLVPLLIVQTGPLRPRQRPVKPAPAIVPAPSKKQ